MIQLITRYIKIKNSNIKIRILPLSELVTLLYILDNETRLKNGDNILKISKRFYKTGKHIIKKCTNVKRPKKKHLFLLDLILKVNLDTVKKTGQKNVKTSKDSIFSLIDILAYEYSWTEKYILENITLEKAYEYVNCIQKRKNAELAKNVISLAHAVHDPSGEYIKSLYGILNNEKRVHYNNAAEYKKNLKGEINE